MRALMFVILGAVCMSTWAASVVDPPGNISGDCISGFVCTGGDPVLCAVAVADSSTACALRRSTQTLPGIVEAAGFDKSLSDVSEPTVVAIAPIVAGSGGGSCPASPTATVFGHTYTVPMDPVCDLASIFGWFLLLGAVIFGAKILGGV